MELDVGDLAALADQRVGVHAKALHVAVVLGNAHVILQEGELRAAGPGAQQLSAEHLTREAGEALPAMNLNTRRLPVDYFTRSLLACMPTDNTCGLLMHGHHRQQRLKSRPCAGGEWHAGNSQAHHALRRTMCMDSGMWEKKSAMRQFSWMWFLGLGFSACTMSGNLMPSRMKNT